MARKRMLDPRIWKDEGFMSLQPLEKLLWLGMYFIADEEGRGIGSPLSLKAKIIPSETINKIDMHSSLFNISQAMPVFFYDVEDRTFFKIDFQSLEKRLSVSSVIRAPEEGKIVEEQKGGFIFTIGGMHGR